MNNYGYDEIHLEWHCTNPDCDFAGEPITETTMEGTDRDGNRGRKMITVECPVCGEIEDSYI